MENTAEDSVDFEINQVSTEEAEDTVSTSGSSRGSKYDPVADAWEKAQEQGEAVTIEDVSKNDVQNIRNLIYRRFDKENVIVRSTKQGDDSFNVAVREREEGEYLRDNSEDSEDTTSEDTTEETEEVEEDGGDTETEFEPSFE